MQMSIVPEYNPQTVAMREMTVIPLEDGFTARVDDRFEGKLANYGTVYYLERNGIGLAWRSSLEAICQLCIDWPRTAKKVVDESQQPKFVPGERK